MEKMIKEKFDNTDLTLQQIADELGTTYKIVWKTVKRCYSFKQRRARKRLNYAKSKTGGKNPMFGKTGATHHNFKGECADGHGYITVIKPGWYTGRVGSSRVFKHTVVMCMALGLTELPAGFVVHHIDGNKTNNDIVNLALLTNGAHTRLHQLGRVTTSRKA